MIATRNVVPPENSISQFSMGDQDTYFAGASASKNCCYINDCQEAESCVDSVAGINITDCYHINHCSRLHRCKFVYESFDCVESSFLFDCRNCEYCFGASNKRNKKYLWWNEQLSEEEWKKRVTEIDLGSFKVLQEQKEKFLQMIKEALWPENFNIQTTNSTGDYLIKCSNNVMSSYGRDGHDNYYCYGMWGGARGNAFSTAVPGDNSYQAGPLGNSANIKFSPFMTRCDDCEYCFGCYESTHCFGCIGLNHKEFHIFNKEYSEEEYWQKLDEIKCAMLEHGEYGQPLPAKFSPSYYPEGGALLYLGLGLEDWDMLGMMRYEAADQGAFGDQRYEGKDVVEIDQIPDNIKDLDPEEWIGKLISDADINRPYTFLKQEIDFYKKHGIAAPRQHFTARVRDILWAGNSGLLEKVQCQQCQKEIIVATNRTFPDKKVYCKKCYLNYLEKYG